jgi:hypothetical protein
MRMLTLKPRATYYLVYASQGRLLAAPGDLEALREVKLDGKWQHLVCGRTPGTPWQPLPSKHRDRLLLLDDWLWRLAAEMDSIRLLTATRAEMAAFPRGARELPIINLFSNVVFTSDFHTLIYQSRDELVQCSLPGEKVISGTDGFGYHVTVRLALSPDDRQLAGLEDGTLIVCRDLKGGKNTRALPHDSQRVLAMAFTADGRQLVSATQRAIYLWDVARERQTRRFEVEGSKLVALAVQPGGPLLLTAHGDHTVALRERDTGRVLRRFDWKIGPLRGVAFAPDGLTAAALGKDGQLFVWDVDAD